jgi:hypothetical protein
LHHPDKIRIGDRGEEMKIGDASKYAPHGFLHIGIQVDGIDKKDIGISCGKGAEGGADAE